LKATGVVWGILLFMFVFGTTRGKFSHDSLSFITPTVIGALLMLLIIVFGLTYFFGGHAGIEIIIEQQNKYIVAIKYVGLIALAISVYGLTISIIKENSTSINDSLITKVNSFVSLFFKTAFMSFLIWIWATNKMKSVLPKKK
jgi:hypothetical protein